MVFVPAAVPGESLQAVISKVKPSEPTYCASQVTPNLHVQPLPGLCISGGAQTRRGDPRTELERLHGSAGFAEADRVAVLEESPHRAAPLCRHYDECGGCSQQQLSYAYQLQAKNTRVGLLARTFTRLAA